MSAAARATSPPSVSTHVQLLASSAQYLGHGVRLAQCGSNVIDAQVHRDRDRDRVEIQPLATWDRTRAKTRGLPLQL